MTRASQSRIIKRMERKMKLDYPVKTVQMDLPDLANMNNGIRGLDEIEGLVLPVEVKTAIAINHNRMRADCHRYNKIMRDAEMAARTEMKADGKIDDKVLAERVREATHDDISKAVDIEFYVVPTSAIVEEMFVMIPFGIIDAMSAMLEFKEADESQGDSPPKTSKGRK